MRSVYITYLYHSGFAVETEHSFFVFDYYMDDPVKGKKRALDAGVLSATDFPKDKQAIVFVSHNHADHFNPEIFKWQGENREIQYVLSSDVRTRNKAIRMSPYEHVDIGAVSIDTYGSTDEGVSFFVQADGVRIFHAGDLNLWHWIEESSEEEVRWAKRAFLKEMEHIKGQAIDLAFFPVDPRMGRGHDAGAAHFARTIKPKLIVPMHFSDQIDAGKTFFEKMDQEGILAWAPSRRGALCHFDPDDVEE